MKKLSQEKVGELNILSTSILWGFFPIISALVIADLEPLTTAAISTGLAAVFFFFVMVKNNLFAELKIKEAWPDMIKGTLIIGVLLYALYFIGLKFTTAGSVSILSQSETLFALFIMYFWKAEKLTRTELIGALLMLVGVVLVLYNASFELLLGDALIIIASFIAPFGNYYQKRAVAIVSSNTMMFVRSIISAVLLFIAALIFEGSGGFLNIESSLFFLLLNGVILLGYSKYLWLEGLKRLTVAKATAITPISPAFTLLFAIPILGEIPTLYQVTGLAILVSGLYLLTKHSHKKV